MFKAIDILIADGEKRGKEQGLQLGITQERKNTEQEKLRAKQEKLRADRAEARVRELERMLKI